MAVSAIQSCIGAVAAAHPSPLPAVQAWLLERMRWEHRLRMIGDAAVLHGGPIEMAEPASEPQTEPAEQV